MTSTTTDQTTGRRIRRAANTQNLIAQKSRKDGRWYFAIHDNVLRSPSQRLSNAQAERWLARDDPALNDEDLIAGARDALLAACVRSGQFLEPLSSA